MTARDGGSEDAAVERELVTPGGEQERHLHGETRGLVVSVFTRDLRADALAVLRGGVEVVVGEELLSGGVVEALAEPVQPPLALELLLLLLRARV